MDPAKLATATAKGAHPPGLHTSSFEPVPEPTVRMGVTTMPSVAIALLQPGPVIPLEIGPVAPK